MPRHAKLIGLSCYSPVWQDILGGQGKGRAIPVESIRGRWPRSEERARETDIVRGLGGVNTKREHRQAIGPSSPSAVHSPSRKHPSPTSPHKFPCVCVAHGPCCSHSPHPSLRCCVRWCHCRSLAACSCRDVTVQELHLPARTVGKLAHIALDSFWPLYAPELRPIVPHEADPLLVQ